MCYDKLVCPCFIASSTRSVRIDVEARRPTTRRTGGSAQCVRHGCELCSEGSFLLEPSGFSCARSASLDFATGRRGLLQLFHMSLSPWHRRTPSRSGLTHQPDSPAPAALPLPGTLDLRISSISEPLYAHSRCSPVTRSPLPRTVLSMSFE